MEEHLNRALYCRAIDYEHGIQLLGTNRQKAEAINYVRLCAQALAHARGE